MTDDKKSERISEYLNEISNSPTSFELYNPEKDVLNSVKILKELEKEDLAEFPLRVGREHILTKHEKFELTDYISITSSNIARLGYTKDGNLLIQFNNGKEYLYSNVPKNEFNNLRDAESVGSSLNKNIKGKYEFVGI